MLLSSTTVNGAVSNDSNNNITMSVGNTVIANVNSSGIFFESGKKAIYTGAVLQVVNVTLATQTSTTSSSFVDSGLSASITPTLSTSKIFVLVSQTIYNGSGTNSAGEAQLLRNSTSIMVEGWSNYKTDDFFRSNFNYLDSPATTSSITYKTQFRKITSGTAASYYSYGDGGGQTKSAITLMEIAG